MRLIRPDSRARASSICVEPVSWATSSTANHGQRRAGKRLGHLAHSLADASADAYADLCDDEACTPIATAIGTIGRSRSLALKPIARPSRLMLTPSAIALQTPRWVIESRRSPFTLVAAGEKQIGTE